MIVVREEKRGRNLPTHWQPKNGLRTTGRQSLRSKQKNYSGEPHLPFSHQLGGAKGYILVREVIRSFFRMMKKIPSYPWMMETILQPKSVRNTKTAVECPCGCGVMVAICFYGLKRVGQSKCPHYAVVKDRESWPSVDQFLDIIIQ